MQIPHPQLVTIVDDFYADPQYVRDRAMHHNYVGPQTVQESRFNTGPIANRSVCDEDMRLLLVNNLTHVMRRPIQNISVEFRYSTENSRSKNVCHADGVDYAGIVYLSLPEFCQGGTSFFRNIPTNAYSVTGDRNQYDWAAKEDWELVYQAEMRFNRAVFYPGDLFHAVTKPFFGTGMNNARLTQNFFIRC